MKAGKRTGRLALCAMMAALALALLFLASLIPTGQIGVAAVAGLCVAISVAAVGYGGGLLCYGAAALLSILLVPAKGIAALFTALFGLYPVLKAWAESWKKRALEYIVKLVFFNAVLALLLLLFSSLLLDFLPLEQLTSSLLWLIFLLLANIVFLCYDFAFTKVMSYFQGRFLPLLKKTGFI